MKLEAEYAIMQGEKGATGKDAIIVSANEPENPKDGQLWQTASGQPIKRWDGTEWVLHYISVENLSVENLSAICADLGTVTAGTIESKNFVRGYSGMEIALEDGTFESYSDDVSASIRNGDFVTTSKDLSTHLWNVFYSGRGIEVVGYDGQMVNIVPALCGTVPDFFVGAKTQTNMSLSADNIPLFATLKKLLNKLTNPVVYAIQILHMTCKANGVTGVYHTPAMPNEYNKSEYDLIGSVFCNTAEGSVTPCTCKVQTDGQVYIAIKNWKTSEITINPEYYAVFVKK